MNERHSRQIVCLPGFFLGERIKPKADYPYDTFSMMSRRFSPERADSKRKSKPVMRLHDRHVLFGLRWKFTATFTEKSVS